MRVESTQALPDTFVSELKQFLQDNQPTNCTVQLRLNTIASRHDSPEPQQDQGRALGEKIFNNVYAIENFPHHPRGYRHNPEVPVLRGDGHCQHCLCAPCVTELRPDFLRGFCGPTLLMTRRDIDCTGCFGDCSAT